MNLYVIKDRYISYLRNFDKRVMINKGHRPYLGIILTVNDCNYFVPLSSQKVYKKTNNQLTKKLLVLNKQGKVVDRLGYLFYLNMIPVPETEVIKINIDEYKKTDIEYYNLLQKQLIVIKYNTKDLKDKAFKVRNNWTKNVEIFRKNCCNYKWLEEKAKEWEIIKKQELER